MSDITATVRVKRHRERRLALGWKHVRVWVPTVAAAKLIKAFAAKERAKAKDDPK